VRHRVPTRARIEGVGGATKNEEAGRFSLTPGVKVFYKVGMNFATGSFKNPFLRL